MIIGVDEVNFSPSLAGDCVVCALAARKQVGGVRDSKQLTHAQRLALWPKLADKSLYAVALGTVHDINNVGVHQARNFAMVTAVRHLLDKMHALLMDTKEASVVLDGYFSAAALNYMRRKAGVPFTSITRGDAIVYEVAAASVVAKVYVDALFRGFGCFYPGYNMEVNHGSPDPVMYEKLRRCGATPYHRTEGYGSKWWRKIMEGGVHEKDKHRD